VLNSPSLRFQLISLLAWIAFGWAPSAWGASFSDALGRKVSLEGTPQRIVTLAPSLTEIVFFLGLGDRLVGVTKFSSYPPEAAQKPLVGSYVDLNIEQIISLSPDLVLGTVDGNQPEKVALLEQAGLPVFVVNPRTIRQVIETVNTIGRLCGVPARAAALSEQLSSKVEDIVTRTEALSRPLVFLQINPKPVMTVNGNTFLHDLIELAGGRNIAAEEPTTYPRISIEEVIQRKPEVIIISSMERGGGFEAARRQWMRWPIIPAVRNNRVHLVDSDLIDRPSPRVVQGLEILARHLHPEADWND
jgi:iron complex transport system substrate-binding protein